MLRARACSSVSLIEQRRRHLGQSSRGADVAARIRAQVRLIASGARPTKSSMRSMQPSAWLRDRLVDVDLAGAVLQAGDHALQPVHRHPRAVRAALAGGAVAGGRRLDQRLAGRRAGACGAAMPLSVATMYSSAPCRRRTAFSSCEVEPTTSACATTRLGRLGVHQHHRVRDAAFRSSSSSRPLNSSCTMQAPFHISMSAPVCSLDVAAQVPVGRPQDLLALRLQVLRRWPARTSW